jgi:hypothetical protein
MEPLMIAKLLLFAGALLAFEASAQEVVKWHGGRMAITSDGNAHDPDDIGGTPMSLALMHAAGLGDRLVHVDYADHFVHTGHHGAASKPEMLTDITFSAEEATHRFGVPTNRVFNCQTQIEAATANFVREALRSTADAPLWFICAGPMTTAHRYLAAVKTADATKLRFIHCVSHSAANGRHDPQHTWDGLKQKFPEAVFHLLKNQNVAGGERGLCSALEHWDWLKNAANADLRWLHTRNRTAHSNAGKFDVSDAGMVYWVLTGAGNERADVDDFRALLEPSHGRNRQ